MWTFWQGQRVEMCKTFWLELLWLYILEYCAVYINAMQTAEMDELL